MGVGARDLPGRLKSIDAGHDNVHENDVRLLDARHADAVAAGCRGQHLMAVLRQQIHQVMRFCWRVVYDENRGHVDYLTTGSRIHR